MAHRWLRILQIGKSLLKGVGSPGTSACTGYDILRGKSLTEESALRSDH